MAKKSDTTERLERAAERAREAAAAAAAAEFPQHLMTFTNTALLFREVADAIQRHVRDDDVLRAVRCDLLRTFLRYQGADVAVVDGATDADLDELLRLAAGGRP